MNRPIKAPKAPDPRGAYAQGWRAGDFIYVSGQVPRDPETGEVVEGTFRELVVRTLLNVELILNAEGATLADVIKFTVILQDVNNIAELNEGFRTVLEEPFPARTTFQGGLMGVPVEIEAIAYVAPDGEGDSH